MSKPKLFIELHNGPKFTPGETVRGLARWDLPKLPKSVELRLLWYTVGANLDVVVMERQRIEARREGEFRFSLVLPETPCSLKAPHFEIVWAVELVALPGAQFERAIIEVTP